VIRVKLIKIGPVADLCGVDRATIYRWGYAGLFVCPETTVGVKQWSAVKVRAWVKVRDMAEAKAARKKAWTVKLLLLRKESDRKTPYH